MFFRPLNTLSTWFPANPNDWPKGAHKRTFFGQHVLWHEYDSNGCHASNPSNTSNASNASNISNTSNPSNPSNASNASKNAKQDTTKNQRIGGRHLSPDTLEPYRQIGDIEVDALLLLWEQEHGTRFPAGKDLLDLAEDKFQQYANSGQSRDGETVQPNAKTTPSPLDRALIKWYQHYAQFPEWVDVEQLHRGQLVFLRYLPAISLSLYYRSLVPGFSIPPLARVLQRTGYLAPPSSRKQVQQRLMDTGSWLVQCMSSEATHNGKDALQPGTGEGWKACLRVRVLHAKVRRGILKSEGGKRKWDARRNGIPMNEEDMCATLLAFSINALLGVETLLGLPLPRQERVDYTGLWKYLGWLLGVRVNQDQDYLALWETTTPLPRALDPCGPGWLPHRPNSLEHGYATLQSIIFHLLQPDASSVEVAHHLLWQGRMYDKDSKEARDRKDWFYYRCLQCRRMVGNPLADALELPQQPIVWKRWRSWWISGCVLTMISLYTCLALPWSPIRHYLVKFHQRNMVRFIERWRTDHMERVREKFPANEQTCPFAMLMPPRDREGRD